MIYARRDFLVAQQGLSVLRTPIEYPATPNEVALIENAIARYLGGEKPIRLRDCGTNIAGTRKARTSIPLRAEDGVTRYRYEERDVTRLDVVIGKVCRTNDDGLDFDQQTMEPYQPEIRLGFSDGSVAVLPLIEDEDDDAGDGGDDAQPDAATRNDGAAVARSTSKAQPGRKASR